MNAFLVHFLFVFRTGLRNRQLLMLTYLFPLGFYALVGYIMLEINPGFQEAMIPAMILFACLAATMLGLPDYVVVGRESGIFRSYKINGVPAAHILLVPILTTILHLALVSALIVGSAAVFFDAPLPANWLGFFGVFLAITLACSALGVLIGVISPSSRVTVLWSQLIFLPSMLIGGLMIPYSLLPAAAQPFARLLPAAHAMNGFRGLAYLFTTDFSPWGSLLTLTLGGMMAFLLAIALFNWDRRNQTRRGHPAWAVLAVLPYALGMLFLV
jgi:ABC-2 type transport system permease protein